MLKECPDRGMSPAERVTLIISGFVLGWIGSVQLMDYLKQRREDKLKDKKKEKDNG